MVHWMFTYAYIYRTNMNIYMYNIHSTYNIYNTHTYIWLYMYNTILPCRQGYHCARWSNAALPLSPLVLLTMTPWGFLGLLWVVDVCKVIHIYIDIHTNLYHTQFFDGPRMMKHVKPRLWESQAWWDWRASCIFGDPRSAKWIQSQRQPFTSIRSSALWRNGKWASFMQTITKAKACRFMTGMEGVRGTFRYDSVSENFFLYTRDGLLPIIVWFWIQWTTLVTWWLIPLSKWVITPVISELTLLISFITGVITHLLSGMSHQVGFYIIFWGEGSSCAAPEGQTSGRSTSASPEERGGQLSPGARPGWRTVVKPWYSDSRNTHITNNH